MSVLRSCTTRQRSAGSSAARRPATRHNAPPLTSSSPQFCWAAAAELHAAEPRLAAAGYTLRIISVGQPAAARKFAAALTPPLPESLLFMDPDRAVYAALGLYSDMSRLFFSPATPAAVAARGPEGMAAMQKANTNYLRAGLPTPKLADTTQQGGLVVIDSSGAVSYAWRDAGTGDHAPISAVLATVEADKRASA